MTAWLNPELARKFHFVAYRYRFLGIYVIIGISSLLFEFLFRIGVVAAGGSSQAGAGLGLLCGLLFAFWGNVRFNFKVPIAKRRRALSYFLVISVGSGIVQFSIRDQLHWLTDWSYEQARLTISGSIFMVVYLFHRRFSGLQASRCSHICERGRGYQAYLRKNRAISGLHTCRHRRRKFLRQPPRGADVSDGSDSGVLATEGDPHSRNVEDALAVA